MRIAFVHTSAVVMEVYRSHLATIQLQADIYHILNEGLPQLLRRGEPRPLVYRRASRLMLLGVDDGAELVVHTGVSTSPAVDMVRAMSIVPILNAADPLAAEAVRRGDRMALIASTTTSPGPAASLLRQHAAANRKEILIETVVRPEAYTALFAGDADRHDAILLKAAEEAAPRVDVLLLMQASLAHLAKPLAKLGKPVLATPPLLMAELARRLALPRTGV